MKNRHLWLAGVLVAMGYVPASQAQGIPGVPAGAVPAATSAASAVGPVAAPRTLWSFLGCSWEQKEQCRRMLCQMPLGQMLNNAGGPISAMTGGLIPSFCPTTPSEEQLKDPGAVGAAAKIKADEAAAKERRAAVRYLGTVDCHYWPEASDALIAALRSDRNECVRYEAALALRNGCCCNKATMEALIVLLSCSDRDGHPRETSARVHAAARQALDKCLACFVDMNPPKQENIGNPEKKEDKGNPEKKGDGNATSRLVPRQLNEIAPARPVGKEYYSRITVQPMEAIVREGRRVLGATQHLAVSQSSGMSLARLFDRSTGVPETQGYIVHGGQPGKVETVSARPTNLWEVLSGNKQPVVVSSYPARSVVVQENVPARMAQQPGTMPVVRADSMPTMPAQATTVTSAPMPAPSRPLPGFAAPVQPGSSLNQPTIQPPPMMPVNTTVPMSTKPVSPVVAPRQSAPATTAAPVVEKKAVTVPTVQKPAAPATSAVKAPVTADVKAATSAMTPVVKSTAAAPVTTNTKPAAKVEVKPVQTIQPVQMTTTAKEAVKTNLQPPVNKVMVTVTEPVKTTTAVKPSNVAPKELTTLQRISMGNVQDRMKALDSLTEQHQASAELVAQLIKTAEEDSNDQVRCSAIRAMVRIKAPAERVVPALSQLGMHLESTVGKEANLALSQISLRMDNVQDRIKALDSLTERHQASAELVARLIKTAEEDSNEQLRCSAIRAMVRIKAPAQRVIPVLSQLGMNLDSAVGKEANLALSQISLRMVKE